MLILANKNELPEPQRLWGTGGWLEPQRREALDWLTLGRLLGWKVSVTRLGSGDFTDESRLIILACDPEDLQTGTLAAVEARLRAMPALVVMRASAEKVVSGDSLVWNGPG